jgi:hypothetical protein
MDQIKDKHDKRLDGLTFCVPVFLALNLGCILIDFLDFLGLNSTLGLMFKDFAHSIIVIMVYFDICFAKYASLQDKVKALKS